MTRLTALVGFLLAALLLAPALAGAAKRHDHHHHRHAASAKKKAHKHHRHHRTKRHTQLQTSAPGTKPSAPAGAAPASPSSASGTGATPRPPAAPAPAPAAPAPSAPAPTPAGGCQNTTAQPNGANVAELRAAVLCLINEQRSANGLVALADNPQLDVAAQGHSDDMVARGYFEHTTPDGVDFSARIFASGYATSTTYKSVAENIAWGSGSRGTPAEIVKVWMGSAGHRANILNGALRDSGIGVAAGAPQAGAGSAGTYTQDFAAR